MTTDKKQETTLSIFEKLKQNSILAWQKIYDGYFKTFSLIVSFFVSLIVTVVIFPILFPAPPGYSDIAKVVSDNPNEIPKGMLELYSSYLGDYGLKTRAFIVLVGTIIMTAIASMWHFASKVQSQLDDMNKSSAGILGAANRANANYDSLQEKHNIIAYNDGRENRFVNTREFLENEVPKTDKYEDFIEGLSGSHRAVVSFLCSDIFENLLLSKRYIELFVKAADKKRNSRLAHEQFRIVVTRRLEDDPVVEIYSKLSHALGYETVFISWEQTTKVISNVGQMIDRGAIENQELKALLQGGIDKVLWWIEADANLVTNSEQVQGEVSIGKWKVTMDPIELKPQYNDRIKEDIVTKDLGVFPDIEPDLMVLLVFARQVLSYYENKGLKGLKIKASGTQNISKAMLNDIKAVYEADP